MERKTIYWNELSEQTKLVLRELSEQTKLVLPTVKIPHSIKNGCSILMFEPEKKNEKFIVGEIVEYNELPGTYTFAKEEGISCGAYSKTTTEEKDAFLLSKNLMISENGEVVRWKPKIGQKYCIPCLYLSKKYSIEIWEDHDVDRISYENLSVFSTSELAIEAHDKVLNSLK